MKARWDGTLVGRDEAGRSFKALLGSSARTGPVFKGGEVIDMPQGGRAPMTEAEQERARIVSLIRGMTTIWRWEHWIDPDPKGWMELHGWRRIAPRWR